MNFEKSMNNIFCILLEVIHSLFLILDFFSFLPDYFLPSQHNF